MDNYCREQMQAKGYDDKDIVEVMTMKNGSDILSSEELQKIYQKKRQSWREDNEKHDFRKESI